MNLNNLLVAMNIICYSGKLNPFDCYNLGNLYQKIMGHKLYLEQKEKKKSPLTPLVEEDVEEVVEEKKIEEEGKVVEEEEKVVEEEGKVVEEGKVEEEGKVVEEEKVEEEEKVAESLPGEDVNNKERKVEIKFVETIDVEDLANIHNLIYTYSKIDGIYTDINKENIEILLSDIKNTVEKFHKEHKK